MNGVYPLILVCIVLVTAGQLCFRVMARQGEGEGEEGVLAALRRPFLWLGILCFIGFYGLWFVVLSKVELSTAYPLTSLDYVLVTICSSVLLKEKVGARRWAGVACIVAGVVLIGGK